MADYNCKCRAAVCKEAHSLWRGLLSMHCTRFHLPTSRPQASIQCRESRGLYRYSTKPIGSIHRSAFWSPLNSMLSAPAYTRQSFAAVNSANRPRAIKCCSRHSDDSDARAQVSTPVSVVKAWTAAYACNSGGSFLQSGDTASSSGRSLRDVGSGVCNRRSLQLAIAAAAAATAAPCPSATALTLQDVTPQVVPAGALSARLMLCS